MVVNYNTILEDVQSQIHTILSSDTTSITFHNGVIGTIASNIKVLDGVPETLVRNVGFPYILVQTPYTSESRIAQNKFRVIINVPIEVYDTVEKNVRRITDTIRKILKSSQATTRAIQLYEYHADTVSLSRQIIDTGKTVYTGNVNIEYRAVLI